MVDLKVKFSRLQLGLRVGSHLELNKFHSDEPSKLIAYGFAIYDRTINIVVIIIHVPLVQYWDSE